MSLDLVTAVLSIISAVLWWKSASIKQHFGYDMDDSLNSVSRKIGLYNAGGAFFSGLAALSQAVKYALF